MSDNKRMKTALVSVFHKDGLDEIITMLHKEGVQLLSTGGTQEFIESLGVPCQRVEDLTGYPSILGGRVKTLHPKVFGGILGRRDLESDQVQMVNYEIPEIDLVIVDLYPFEATVASGASHEAIIEKIDIGGISLIRAAAKNHKDVVIVASKDQYAPLADILRSKGAQTTLEERVWFAKEAFGVSSLYDSAIFNYFDGGEGSMFRKAVNHPKALRYGENPHQQATFYRSTEDLPEFTDYNMTNRTYRYYTGEALYPFGYGLSYGDCAVTGLTADRTRALVSVCNRGSRDTDEVLQLYLKDEESPFAPPKPVLCGFQRVFLAAGEEKLLSVPLDEAAFTVVTDGGERVAGSGRFTLYAGFGGPDVRTEALTGRKSLSLPIRFTP